MRIAMGVGRPKGSKARSGKDIEAGVAKIKAACQLERAICSHRALMDRLGVRAKELVKANRVLPAEVNVGDMDRLEALPARRGPAQGTGRRIPRKTRRHTRRAREPETEAQTEVDGNGVGPVVHTQGSGDHDPALNLNPTTQPLSDELLRIRRELRYSLANHPCAYKGDDKIGGEVEFKEAGSESNLTVCTLNIAGLSDDKLDLILQLMTTESIDVLFCIDAQLTTKQGNFMAKKAKCRLGTGTVVHVTPSLDHFGGKAKEGSGGSVV